MGGKLEERLGGPPEGRRRKVESRAAELIAERAMKRALTILDEALADGVFSELPPIKREGGIAWPADQSKRKERFIKEIFAAEKQTK